jgi:hypothetical protein
MNDIFISYAREDKAWARRLAEALEERGWRVWWDVEIPPGETWDEVIERELTAAKAVIVLWSATAVKKRWVKTEASLALDANKLLPVLIDSALPPIAFRPIQAASLVDWQGGAEHEGFALLVAQIERLAGAPGEAPPAGVAAGRSRDVPSPNPARARVRPLVLGAAGVVGAAAVAAVAIGVFGDGEPEKVAPAAPPTKPAVVTPVPADPPARPAVAQVPGSVPGRYPQASQRLLTDADLSGMSADDLRLMRNEIFARRGYIFNDAGLRDYFQAQAWYRPVSRDDVKLSAVEQANVAKIRAFEQDVDKINR